MQMKSLAGKVALVTGAARRIGAEISRTLHDAGMNIVLHYHHSEAEAIQLCQQLNAQRPSSAVAYKAALGEPDEDKKLIEKAVQAFGRLDALVNNASRFYRTPMGDVTNESWEDLMNSNLKSPYFLSQAAAPALTASKGCIVNITDIHAERPLKTYSVYCISKAGLLMMTKALAKELGPHVRVNAVAPGAVIWPEGENLMTETEKNNVIGQTVLKRHGTPEDIATAVLFLIRDAEYVSGQVLNVDGGRSISA
jgi:pteridine reductase